jgi:cytochrome c-type biogenesis protein CcmH
MPLAIVRKQVSDLPLSVSLTDSLAMTPTMKLSNFSTVKLLARISKSGNAMKQPGDLIGVIEDVTVTDKTPHTLIINSAVK